MNRPTQGMPDGMKIAFSERLGYGFGDMASNVVVTAVSMFLMFYYTDVVGVSAGIIGTIIFVSRIFDGITDLGMGVLVDKTKSKHGKARPWLLWMAVPLGIVTVLVFSVPEGWTETAQLVYIAITYNLLFLIYMAINVPYGTLNALISQDQHERSILNIFRMTMAVITGTAISYITVPLTDVFGGGPGAWQLTFATFSAVGIVLFFLCFLMTKERAEAADEAGKSQNTPLKQGVKALFKNKYWLMIVLTAVAVFILQAFLNGISMYYAEYILGDPALVGTMALFFNLPILAGLLGMAPLLKRFGKRNVMIGGLVIIIAGSLLVLVNAQSVPVVVSATAIRGLGFAALAGTIFAMIADTIEYGEWKNGIRTEGLVYSGGSFGTKVGGGLGAAMIGWFLSFGGFSTGGVTAQPDSVFTIIELIFVFVPVIVSALLVLLLYFYRLDREYPQIMADLQAEKEAKQA